MTITKKAHKLSVVSFWAALLMTQSVMAEQPSFMITNGNQVDAETYVGYTLFQNWCARCHGTFGQGLAGPNLVASMKKISKPEFMRIVALGRTTSTGVMPAWKTNKAVMDGRENIYRYLKARADGLIGEVKPIVAP